MGLTNENKDLNSLEQEKTEIYPPFRMGAVLHWFNLVACEMIYYAMELGVAGELSDLKGMIDVYRITNTDENGAGTLDVELDLLESVEDSAIKVVLKSIAAVQDCTKVFAMINNLDYDEVMFDLDDFEQACNDIYLLSTYETGEDEYREVLDMADVFYCYLDRTVFEMMLKLRMNDRDIWDVIEDEYLIYVNGYDEGIERCKNECLLRDLAEQLMGHCEEISDYRATLPERERRNGIRIKKVK